jgi:hypothetical protein
MSKPVFREWALDISQWPARCYCPYKKDGTIVIGLNLITDRCPGKLVALFHQDGQDVLDKWCAENPEALKELETTP